MRESAIQNKQKCQELFWSGVDKIYGVEMQKNEVQSNACRENTIIYWITHVLSEVSANRVYERKFN